MTDQRPMGSRTIRDTDHGALFLGVLTFMYLSTRAVADKEYRTQFIEPLVGDLRLTPVARNRYRHHVATGAQ